MGVLVNKATSPALCVRAYARTQGEASYRCSRRTVLCCKSFESVTVQIVERGHSPTQLLHNSSCRSLGRLGRGGGKGRVERTSHHRRLRHDGRVAQKQRQIDIEWSLRERGLSAFLVIQYP